MRLKWLNRAVDDLVHVRNYIAQDNPEAAQEVAGRILTTISYIQAHPEIGRPGRRPQTREIIVPGLPFIIPYRVKHGAIEILRVFHTSRQWTEK